MTDHGITTTVSRAVAVGLIERAGGHHVGAGEWDLNGKHYWQTDEALMIALVLLAGMEVGG